MNTEANTRIPVYGLPVALETLLGTLVTSFDLKSWNIHSDYNGVCCLKIRWKPSNVSVMSNEGESHKIKPAKYKKKSKSTETRDYERSAKYHGDDEGIRTRSKAAKDTPKEQKRGQDYVSETAEMPTPETIVSDSPITLNSPLYQVTDISPQLRSVVCDSPNEMVSHQEPLTQCNFNLPQPTLSDSVLQLENSDSDDQASDFERSPNCDQCLCMYHTGHPSDYPDFCVFRCDKCNKTVCKRCFEKFDCHDYHTKYLRKLELKLSLDSVT